MPNYGALGTGPLALVRKVPNKLMSIVKTSNNIDKIFIPV
jgi:hypothetical protein